MELTAKQPLISYLNQDFTCSCGKVHYAPIKAIEICSGALLKIPELLTKYQYKNLFLVSDSNTQKAAGEKLFLLLKQAGFSVTAFVFPDSALVPDENALGRLLTNYPFDCDLILAVGTGTINDLCKYLSYKVHRDYFIIGTAPSMDGFASNVSCLITNHMKTTYETHLPAAIIGDIDILCQAPKKMIAAGVGDILGKYVCLLDWKLSSIINGEYHCKTVEDIVKESIQTIVSQIAKIDSKNPAAIGKIMEGLVLSGIAMSFIGNSRPASGSEHHLSHYWELKFLSNNRPAVLHGIKVGIGTIISGKLYEFLKKSIIDFIQAEKKAQQFNPEEWKKTINHVYGTGAEEVILLEEKVGKNKTEHVISRLTTIQTKWQNILLIIDEYLPDTANLTALLKQAGAPVLPCEEDISLPLVYESVCYAKELRNRYGLLQLLFDLGLSEAFADNLVKELAAALRSFDT